MTKKTLEKDNYSKSEVEQLLAETTDGLRDELDLIKAENDLSAEEREFIKGMGADEKEDFLTQSPEQRAALVAKAEADKHSDVIYKSDSGEEFTKNDDPRLVKMAKERDEDRREIAKQAAASRHAEFTKRAEAELGNLPGTVETHVALLKAVDGIENADLKEGALSVLKAQNEALAPAFNRAGSAGGSVSKSGVAGGQSAHENLESLAKKYVGENPDVSFSKAYEIVGDANPDLLAQAIKEG